MSPVSEFLCDAYSAMSGDRPPLADWTAMEGITFRRVLTVLTDAGLCAEVVAPGYEYAVPLAEWDRERAGLVRLRTVGGSAVVPSAGHHPDSAIARYQSRVSDVYGFTPHAGLPRNSLRAFCGQHERDPLPVFGDEDEPPDPLPVFGDEDEPPDPFPWLDHCHGWVDRHGDYVLTVEPYAADWGPDEWAQVVRDVSELPLRIERRPGLWAPDSSVLLILTHAVDHDHAELPATWPTPDMDAAWWAARMAEEEQRQMARVRPVWRYVAEIGLTEPGLTEKRRLIQWVVKPDNRDEQIERLVTFGARMLAHVAAGHLGPDDAWIMIRNLSAEVDPNVNAYKVLDVSERRLFESAVEWCGGETA